MTGSEADVRPAGRVPRLLSKLASLVWWLLLLLLVLTALYAGFGRLLTNNINDYRTDIEQELSQRLNEDVSIGSLSSRWNGLNPTIIARDLVVRSGDQKEQVVGSLQDLRIGLDFMASLLRFRIVLSDFDANGLELVLNQTAEGEVGIEGVDLPEPAVNDLEKWVDLADRWLSEPSVRITRVELGLRDGAGALRHVEIPQLDLIYQHGLLYASGRAMRPGTTDQLASFVLVGQHFFRNDFTGQFYGDINSGRLFDGLAHRYIWNGIRADGFDLGGQVWLTFRDGSMEQASGILTTPYLQLGLKNESLAPFEDIGARFGWRREMSAPEPDLPWYEQGEFHLQNLSWRWNEEPVSGLDFRFHSTREASELIVNGLPVGPVRRLVSGTGLLPAEAHRALDNYQPAGTLNHVLLTLPDEDPGDFRLHARLHDVDVKAHDGAPGIKGLDGSLTLDRHSGFVNVDSDTLTLGLPLLFRGDWDVRDARAGVSWRLLEGDVIKVYADNISLQTGQNTQFSGAFDLRLVTGGEDVLGLQVDVENGTAAMLADFVPVHLVDPGLYQWLTTAIVDANIVSGTYYGHGRIDSGSPPGSFISSMEYEVKDARVRYDERWPDVVDASGRVFVQGDSTRVELASGQTGGIELRPGQVRVEPGPDGTTVYVDVAAPVDGEALKRWMVASPLGEMAGAAGESIVVEGKFHLDLNLALALDSDSAPVINARVKASSGSLTYPASNLKWTELNGDIAYNSDSGFSGGPLQAQFLNRPVSVWFRRSESADAVSIRQKGDADITTLLELVDLSEDTSLGLSGRLNYEAVLDVSADAASEVAFSSDLTGLTVDWPEPLAKPAAEAAPLNVVVRPLASSGVDVQVNWQERADLDLKWYSDQIEATISELQLGDYSIGDLTIGATRGPDNWLINATSDWVRGMIAWPVDNAAPEERVVTVDLVRLAVMRDQETSDNEPPSPTDVISAQAFRELEPERWPDIDVKIANLEVNGENVGTWSFWLAPEADRLQVQNINGQFQSLTLEGELEWGIANEETRTAFKGALVGESFGDIDNLIGTAVPFRSETTAIELDLNWPGRPDQFDVSGLSGYSKVRFDDGVILEGNNTARLFRVFSLLNSDTLWRRLQLDFSDLYEDGIAFDAISGQAIFTNGVLTLDPELQIVGPSGAFKFSGASNMADESLDMSMVVVLPLTQNLPLAALLLGASAPIGGALFVLDKVLGDPLSKLTSATYSVTGSWDDPEVKLKRVFDNGN